MNAHSSRRRLLRTLLAGALLPALGASAQSWAWDDGTTPFVVTPDAVVERMLRLAAPKAGEHLIDLGSGDGRIVIEAARRFGASGFGVDIDPALVKLARENAERAGVASRAQFEVQDLFTTDLSKADVVTMYLLPEVNLKLRPRLVAMLKPGARIVSHDYDLGDWTADESIDLRVPDKLIGPQGRSRVMLWVVPADLRGRWSADVPEHGGRWTFDIRQKHQMLEVEARSAAGDVHVRSSGVLGREVVMLGTGKVAGKVWNHRFHGVLEGERIAGELRVSDGDNTRRFPWSAMRSR